MKDHGNYPVTIGDTIAVAKAKRWDCPPMHGEKKWPELPPSGLWDKEVNC